MRQALNDSRHLLVAASLFGGGVLVFLVIRALLVPEGFGELGHYRAGALEDNRDRAPAFAGQAACEACHADAAHTKAAGPHRGVHCEACHGALAGHAADPTTSPPARPEPLGLCLRCHLANLARPPDFPQIEPREHGGGESCGPCHAPHDPTIR